VSDFQGDGTTTSFTLTANPFSENNTQVYIDGVYQEKTGYSVLGTVLTFSQAPPNLSGIEVTMLAAEEIQIGTTSADLVSYTPAGAGAVVTDVQTELRKQSASDGTVYTPAGAGAVATTVQAKLRESVSVKDFGAVGDGVANDTAAFQLAVNAAKTVKVPYGTYLFASTVTVTTETNIVLEKDATIIGSGLDTNYSLFSIAITSGDFSVIGGIFKSAKMGIEATDVDSININNASFENLGYGISIHNVSSGITASVGNSNFTNLEVGIGIQTSVFENVIARQNTFKTLHEQTLTLRPYPLEKKITSGFWLQSLSGTLSVIVNDNFVDGVIGFAVPSAEPEVHGLAASCITGAVGRIVIDGNIVKNVNGQASVEGDEGILGRGNSVIISNNILFDAGMREGCIYAKGSDYHEISHNIIEISLTHPLLSSTRGIISASGTNFSQIHGNQFINTAFGIYSRSLNEKVENNQFINNDIHCHTLALEDLTYHVKTEVCNNFADPDCGKFFVVGTTSGHTNTYGDIVITNNKIYGKAESVTIKSANTLIFSDNYVDRVSPDTSRETILYKDQVEMSIIKNNDIRRWDNSLGTGRFLTGYTNWTPRLIATGNMFYDDAVTSFYLLGGTYVDIIITDNFFQLGGSMALPAAVTGNYVISRNIGLDPIEVSSTAVPTTGTWSIADRVIDSTPSAGGTLGWVCVTAGTFSSASDVTGDTDGSTGVITGLTDTSDFFLGNYVTVSSGMPSASTPYRIIAITSTTLTLNVLSTSAQSNVTIVTVNPTFKTFANIAA
jgi:hypothetical protein